MPRLRAADGLRIETGLPLTRISPDVAGVMPKMVRASSVLPEPISPAMPRISPARKVRSISRTASPQQSPRSSRATSPGTVSAFGKSWSMARPTIIETRSDSLDLADRLGGDMGAVAQHRHPVGESEDLRQLVGDIGDADAALAQPPDHLQQPARIRIRQCGRRLVHDDQLGVLRQGLGDLDPLSVRHREAADDGIDVEIMAVERIEQGASAGPHGGPVHAAPAGARRMADIDVLRHAQLGEEQQFLIDRGDALGRRLAGR